MFISRTTDNPPFLSSFRGVYAGEARWSLNYSSIAYRSLFCKVVRLDASALTGRGKRQRAPEDTGVLLSLLSAMKNEK